MSRQLGNSECLPYRAPSWPGRGAPVKAGQSGFVVVPDGPRVLVYWRPTVSIPGTYTNESGFLSNEQRAERVECERALVQYTRILGQHGYTVYQGWSMSRPVLIVIKAGWD